MRSLEKYISPFTEQLFPEFYRSEGPNFIAFVKAYYEWLETNDQVIYEARRLPDYRDIDKTLEDFLVQFKTKYLNNIQFTTASNKRLFIKNSLDFYRAKGTERAVDLYFKLIHGLEAQVYYPGDDIFRLSDNDFRDIKYLEVTYSPSNVLLVGSTVTGKTSGATAYIEKLVRKKAGAIYIDVFYITNLEGNFSTNEIINSTALPDHYPKILGSLSSLTINNGGANFTVGEDVYISTGTGRLGKARVTAITLAEGTIDFELIDGGFGYTTSSEILISEKVVQGNSSIGFNRFETVTEYLANISFDSADGDFAVGDSVEGYDGANGDLIFDGTILTLNQFTGKPNGSMVVNFSNTSIDLANVGGSDSLHVVGNSVNANVTSYTNITATGNVIASNSTNFFGIINVENNFVTNGKVWGNDSGESTFVYSVGVGSDAAFSIEAITNDYVFEYSSNLISEIVNTSINAISNSIISDLFVFSNTTIGTIDTIGLTNPGTGYNVPPLVVLIQQNIASLEKHDYTLGYTSATGNFTVGEKIIANTSGAIGSILSIGTNSLSVRRLSIAESFQVGDGITGQSSLKDATISTVSTTFSSNVAGNNAVIELEALVADGKVTSLDIISSGFGYANGETITFTSVDNSTKTGTAVVNLNRQGIGEGYYKNRKSFLSADKYIQDNDFYQEFSYQVLTGLPFEQYSDVLKKVLHVAGTKAFGKYFSASEVETEITVSESSITAE